MSHICKGEAREFLSYEDIMKAADILGWKVRLNEPVRYYYGKGQVCDMVLEFDDRVVNERGKSLNKKYNIGFVKNKKGAYEAIYDNAMNGTTVFTEKESDTVTKRVIGMFKQAYYEVGIKRQALSKRKTVLKQVATDGTVRLRIVS